MLSLIYDPPYFVTTQILVFEACPDRKHFSRSHRFYESHSYGLNVQINLFKLTKHVPDKALYNERISKEFFFP